LFPPELVCDAAQARWPWAAQIADVRRRIHIAIGVVEVEPVVLVRRQRRAQAYDPGVVDMIEWAVVRRTGRGSRGSVLRIE